MTQDIKDEALKQSELDILFGFENEEELFESIREVFYDEKDFDEDWLKQEISEKYNQHQNDSLTWTKPTDFEKLAKTFDELIKEKIVCLHNAGYTKQDAEGDCMEAIERLNQLGIKASGFCYYHSQDLARVVDPEIRSLYLGFGSSSQEDIDALQVAGKIVDAFTRNGFEINWTGTVYQRIEIRNINWRKVPDDEDWGIGRVVEIMTRPTNVKKPFWKFW